MWFFKSGRDAVLRTYKQSGSSKTTETRRTRIGKIRKRQLTFIGQILRKENSDNLILTRRTEMNMIERNSIQFNKCMSCRAAANREDNSQMLHRITMKRNNQNIMNIYLGV